MKRITFLNAYKHLLSFDINKIITCILFFPLEISKNTSVIINDILVNLPLQQYKKNIFY